MKKMSVCGEFAEHVWKPGSCKNCFCPSSAHRSNVNLVRASADANEDNCLNLSASFSKPTIAVRPTMMNPDTLDMLTDVNVNIEQDNQKYVIDKLSLMEILELAPFYIDKNGCSKTLKEVVMQNTSLGKLDYPCKFSPGTLSSSAHKEESLFISGIFVTQEEGHGPLGLKENGTSNGYRPQVTKTVKTNSQTSGSVQRPERMTSSTGSCEGHRNVLSDGPARHEQQAPLDVGFNTSSTNAVSSGNTEPPNPCIFSSFTTDRQPQGPLGHHCSCVDSQVKPTSTSVSHSCGGSMPCCSRGQSCLEKPQTFLFLPHLPSDNVNRPYNAEPIYAESTKRKKKAFGEIPSQQPPALGGEPAMDNQGAKINTMAGSTGEPKSQMFYLRSSGSAMSSPLCTQLSSTSSIDPRCPTSKWCCNSTVVNAGSHPSRSQGSPPIPPKRSSCSLKFEAVRFPPAPQPEVHVFPSVSTQLFFPPQAQSKAQEEVQRPIPAMPALEPRLTPHTTQIAGEEKEKEEGGKDVVPQCEPPGFINVAAVLEPRDWCPVAHSKERTPPGTVHNGVSHQCLDKLKMSMLTKGTSSTAILPEGKSESKDPTPPPPPPKKHHRVPSKMSKPISDLEKANWNDSVESFAQPLSILSGGFTASSDSLHSNLRIFNDVGHQGAPYLASLPLCLASSLVSPLPDPLPSTSLGSPLQPPPLPEKKLVNRTAPVSNGVWGRAAPNPRFLPSRPEGGIWSGTDKSPSATMTQPIPCSSNKPLEPCRLSPVCPPCSRTLDELPSHLRAAASSSFSSSSPQFSVPPLGSGLHLQKLLSNMDSREGVYSKLGGLYAESLRRLALKCEDHFTRSQRNPLRFDESNWSLFKLTCSMPCCDAGDAIYYSASCASDPYNSYAVKICKSLTQDTKQDHLYGLSSMLPPDEEDEPPGQSEQERVVVITREVPRQSAADFVREWAAFHQAQPEAYERRVCFLLLQLCNGLEHLKEHGVTHRHLCLENLLLVPRGRHLPDNQNQLPRLLVSSFSKAKRRSAKDPTADRLLRTDRSRLAPEILSATQYRKFDEFQTGILIYELLHRPNPFEANPELKERDYRCEDLPPIPTVSLYSAGLQQLARLLLHPDPIKRIHIQEAKRALQSLLWGPRQDLMEQQRDRGGESPRYEGLLNWLDVKRALLMMKFAERSLEPEQSAELEDWLCCQYFSSANPPYLCHAADLLYFK
ncbi:hypothetical protein AAFF_G00425830 [Aldrovandia affinis]|uniref:Protein kinase domain-containing protein n=1 Tax=Aldrovandia affinis TaxID=143900 RepID=A0AAD7X0D6_9TELE|nr:hypothetical protein AAFF_G00425830 [Aldrovandia affinis]